MTVKLVYKEVESPIGKLKLVASDAGLVAIVWHNDRPRRVRLGELVFDDQHPVILETERQLQEYFAGKRKTFSVSLDMRGTRFQKDVWEALLAIPFSETRTYGQLAMQLGNPRATRAVGAANGRNPIAIIVPCHRVIGSTGKPPALPAASMQRRSCSNLNERDTHLPCANRHNFRYA